MTPASSCGSSRGGRGIAQSLAERLSSATEAPIRRACVIALAGLGIDDAPAHLFPALRDPSTEVRLAAVQALATVDQPEVRARLAELLADPDESVRSAIGRLMRTPGRA